MSDSETTPEAGERVVEQVRVKSLICYPAYLAESNYGGRPTLKICINGVPTAVIPALNMRPGDCLAVIRRECLPSVSPLD